ncbi:MAG: hypothetical protein KDD45_04450 [Bdellovibrionales bacterium]|nr:hypothetical protein [Bdellovibrionales bacterium]
MSQSAYLKGVLEVNNQMMKAIERNEANLNPDDFLEIKRSQHTFYNEIIEQKKSTIISRIERTSQFIESSTVVMEQGQESEIVGGRDNYISELVGKVNKYES